MHQVHAPHLLRHAVLHLQPGIDLEEIETLRRAVVDKLHRPGAAVVHCFSKGNGRATQRLRHPVRQIWRRGLFNHFLVTSLQRAVAHAEGDNFPLPVAEDLHLQMAGAFDIFFEKHPGVAEVVLPQPLYRGKRLAQFAGVAADAHANPSAARRALEHHRVAHRLSRPAGFLTVGQQFAAFQQRNALRLRQGAGGMLQAEGSQLLRSRANKRQSRRLTGFGEGGVFRQKPVAGMDSAGAALQRGGNDLLYHQIGLRCRPLAKAERLIRFADVQTAQVGFGVNGDALHLHGAQGAQNAAGNRPAVGNQ